MRIVVFCHSILSDWNHGNAHFLRGIAFSLTKLGHSVTFFEPQDSWSLQNLTADHGTKPIVQVQQAYPFLSSVRYAADLDLDQALDAADLVLVHEWNEPELVARIGQHHRRNRNYKLLFHDTHHRTVTASDGIKRYDLSSYDGVLAFGNSVADQYRNIGWGNCVWTWHEAADTRLFQPLQGERDGDLVWIGNWGDDERTGELREFLFEPVAALRLRTVIHGVRYPPEALALLAAAGIEYRGWLPNYEVPSTLARYGFTVHIPRRPYAETLRGVPTIRVFEALACGIPLLSAPWSDEESLFRVGRDFLMVNNGAEMRTAMRSVLFDAPLRSQLIASGLETIRSKHTCDHRAAELMEIFGEGSR